MASLAHFRSTVMVLVLMLAITALRQAPYVHAAEGFTAPDTQHGIDVDFRRFSAPDTERLCAAAPRPASFASGAELALHVGDWLSFDRIAVVARDASGRTLPPVPITLEVADAQPPIAPLRSDSLSDGGVTLVRSGTLDLRIRGYCSPRTSLLVHVRVDER